ncbi:MAG: hypothetical protein ACK5OC_27295, partial [Pirellula sp.]
LWPCAAGESGSLAIEPYATSRASRRGGGFHLLLRLASGEPYAPVGRAVSQLGECQRFFDLPIFFNFR